MKEETGYSNFPYISNPDEYYKELYGMIGAAEKSCHKTAIKILKKKLYPKPITYSNIKWDTFNPPINRESGAEVPQKIISDQPDEKDDAEDDADAE